MATLEEVYTAIKSDKETGEEFSQAWGTDEALEAFLDRRGCTATADEARAFLTERAKQDVQTGELPDEELATIGGGEAQEFAHEKGLRHKYQCPVCGSTELKRVSEEVQTYILWILPYQCHMKEWIECCGCGKHYSLMGGDLIMLE